MEYQFTGVHMESSSFLSEFQRVLSPDTARLVYTTLRRDPLIWNALQEESFFQKAAERFGDNTACWSPAGLALLSVSDELNLIEIASPEMTALDRTMRQYALHAYEEIRREGKPPDTLRTAGLAALALRERRRLTRSWQGMTVEMIFSAEAASAVLKSAWSTPLACLFGFAPEPGEFIAALAGDGDRWPANEIIAHVLLTNPIGLVDQLNYLIQAVDSASVQEQLKMLRYLQRIGEKDLANGLARRLLQEQTGQSLVSWTVNDRPEESLYKAHELAQRAGLHRYAGETDQAYALIEKAREATRSWMASLNAQLIEMSIGVGGQEIEPVLVDEITVAADRSAVLQSDLTLSLGKYSQAKTLVEKISEPLHPFAQIVKAAALAIDDRDAAQSLARKAIARIMKESTEHLLEQLSDLIFDWQPAQLVQTLIDLDLLGEARNLAQMLLQNRPNDLNLFGFLSFLFQKLGSLADAIEASRSALVLDPHSPERHRRLADLWEVGEDWENAFQERTRTVELTGGNELEDRLAYIRSAIRSGRLDAAISACDEILLENPNHGMAHTFLGWALMEKGQLQDAINVLSKATLLIPEEAQPWLMLSDAYRRDGENRRAVEILRAGVLSSPDSPDINFSLASACLESGSMSEALPFLKKAASLTPNHLEITLELGNTLLCLGSSSGGPPGIGKRQEKVDQQPRFSLSLCSSAVSAGRT
jgi:tetratricopeptide (TPR) repeat protein